MRPFFCSLVATTSQPAFFVKQGMSVVSSLGFTTLMSLGGPVGALIGMWLGDRIGRKRGIIVFSILAMLLGILYPYSNDPTFLSIVGFGLVTVIYILVASRLPSTCRNSSLPILECVGRVSAIPLVA